MLIFYDYPANFETAQDNANARNISSRSLQRSASAGVHTLKTGGKLTNTVFVVTQGARSVLTFGASKLDTDTNFYLKEVAGYQYTLHTFGNSTSDFTLTTVGGTIYRCMVMNVLETIDSNKFFRNITPARRNQTEQKQTSIEGNISYARYANSSQKRRIQFQTGAITQENRDKIIRMSEYKRLSIARNTRKRYDDVFPCKIEGDVTDPYFGKNWNANRPLQMRFTVQEL